MPDERTLQTLINRIADEIKTDDLLSTDDGSANIFNAVRDAVGHYQRESLFIMDTVDRTVATVTGTDVYNVPENLIALTELWLIRNGLRYPMVEKRLQFILAYKTQYNVPDRGQPYNYNMYDTDRSNGQIIVWPAPDQDGDLFEFWFQGRIPFPESLNTSNWWTTVAEEMIRNRAKWLLNIGVLRNPDDAQLDKSLEQSAYENLTIESIQKQATGTLKATHF